MAGRDLNVRVMVRGAYDVQKLRIQMGNRIVQNFKVKLGQAPNESEATLDDESKELLAKIRAKCKVIAPECANELEEAKAEKEKNDVAKLISKLLTIHYDILTANGVPAKKKFKGDPVISDYTEFCLITQYRDLEKQEARHFYMLGNVLQDYPIYTGFLEGINGIGPAMAGVLISEIDIHKSRHPSSIWMYAGLDCAEDGKGRSRRKEHLVPKEYLTKDKKKETKMSITFNPFLKTKLMGVLAGNFLRSGKNPYKDIYDGYKNRLEQHPDWQDKVTVNDKGKEKVVNEKGHRHNAAMRYMVKMFLIDLYVRWREIEGLPVSVPYHEAKLGMVHGGVKTE